MSARQIAVALLCFSGKKAASKHQDALEQGLRSAGDKVLESTILEVNENHEASVHDTRRVLAGTLTAALTWGLFGLVAGTDRLESTVIWAVLGAICGGVFAYTSEHLATKSELQRIGRSLAPNSSALAIWVETGDAARLLTTAAPYTPSAASVATIDADLAPCVFSSEAEPTVGGTSPLNMLLYRYPDSKTAAKVAKAVATGKPGANGAPQIELVIETDGNGHRRVTDPTHGTAALARSDLISWALFGVVFGAIAGAIAGGFHGAVHSAIVTGVGWGVFGIFAGALYGLWAGRSISARRLKGVGSLLGDNTSAVVVWADGSVQPEALEAFTVPGSKQLILHFNSVAGGAILQAN